MNSTQQHVILGTGPVGMAIMRELVGRGTQANCVRMVNRRGSVAEAPAGVEVVKADLYDPAEVRRVTGDATVVYATVQPEYHEWVTKFIPLQTAILDGLAGSGARLLVMENLYVYGEVDGPIHENLPFKPHTRKGKVRAQMAEQVQQAHARGTIRAVQVRASDFYGPNVLGSTLGEREFYPVLAGKGVSGIGNLDVPHSYTYIEDIGRAMVTLASHDQALGQAWHVPNAPAQTQRQILTRLCELAGVPVKVGSMGRLMMMLGGLFIPAARETVEMLYEFEKPFVVDHSKYTRAFGETPTSIEEGLKRTLAWYRAHPEAAH